MRFPVSTLVDVEAAQLADPDAGGVQHLDDQPVPQRQRIALLGAGFRGGHGRERLILAQHRRQGAVRLGHLQPGGRIRGEQTAPRRPRGERLDRRGATSQRRARGAGPGRGGQPGPQQGQAQAVQADALTVSLPVEEIGQRAQVAQVGATGVRRTAALQVKVFVELLEDRLHSPTLADRRTVLVSRRAEVCPG